MWSSTGKALLSVMALVSQLQTTSAIQVDLNNRDAVKDGSKQLVKGVLEYYKGHPQPGLMPNPPWYWWLGGAMFGQIIEYWKYTGDDTYTNMVINDVMYQIGEHQDFEPKIRVNELGNDDQAFWAFAALSAAELNFPEPPADKPSWISLAQAVFNRQVSRWDTKDCGGGLNWQISPNNRGFDYKNTISNGGLFQIAARLARYTGNTTYAEWADKTWDWMQGLKYVDADWRVYDGGHIQSNCTNVSPLQWTYNVGTLLAGSAYMYNHTSDPKWKKRVDGLLKSSFEIFFPKEYGGNTLIEVACEFTICNNDQPSFKSYLIRWMAITAQLVPDTASLIAPKMSGSAKGAMGACSQIKSDGAVMCGRNWTSGAFDGKLGLGEQMAALSTFLAHLTPNQAVPLTANNGGKSVGNASAGTDDPNRLVLPEFRPITTADKAGAGILTTLLLIVTICAAAWIII